jgi:phosphoenolpyruvate---glycerone phosphotransferase subunit DhaL
MALTTSSAAAWMASFAAIVHANAAYLTELDSAIGDADHGVNLERGMKAVVDLDASAFDSASALLKKVGMTLVSTVGGASGPLYGTFFLRVAAALPADGEVTADIVGDALQAGLDGIVQRGKAEVGDKTMVDALAPAVAAFRASVSDGLAAALAAAARAGAEGRDATVPLVARKGRASYLGERSAGHQDPGATSITMLLDAAATTLTA